MIREVDVHELAAARQSGVYVLDVREPAEYVHGHVPAAVLMPMRQVLSRISELPSGEPIYVICASGNRSRTAAAWLTDAGLDARSVRGGTTAWAASGRPVVYGPHADAA